MHVNVLHIADQYIHIEVCGLDHNTQYAATILYAFNQLEKRKELWKKVEYIGSTVNGP